jgi:hypothetical protein
MSGSAAGPAWPHRRRTGRPAAQGRRRWPNTAAAVIGPVAVGNQVRPADAPTSSSAKTAAAAIESQVNEQPKRVYHAGESWYETPGSSHRVSRNASATEPAKLLAVFVVDTEDKTLTTPAP